MTQLHQLLAAYVNFWRDSGYPSETYPSLAEVLEYQVDAETHTTRFLRLPQLHALETYWYLRLAAGTPHIFDLYRELYPSPRNLREALGLTADAIRDFVEDNGQVALWERIRAADDFVNDFRLEALCESLNLAYPSCVLVLGAGKTILIGVINTPPTASPAEALTNRRSPFLVLIFAPLLNCCAHSMSAYNLTAILACAEVHGRRTQRSGPFAWHLDLS